MRGLTAVALALAVFAGWNAYDRWWRHRGCFNELGRCFDPATGEVYLEQAGLVWGGLAALALLAAGMAMVKAARGTTLR